MIIDKIGSVSKLFMIDSLLTEPIYDHPPSLQRSIQYQYQSNTSTTIVRLKVKGAVISRKSMNQAIIVIDF